MNRCSTEDFDRLWPAKLRKEPRTFPLGFGCPFFDSLPLPWAHTYHAFLRPSNTISAAAVIRIAEATQRQRQVVSRPASEFVFDLFSFSFPLPPSTSLLLYLSLHLSFSRWTSSAGRNPARLATEDAGPSLAASLVSAGLCGKALRSIRCLFVSLLFSAQIDCNVQQNGVALTSVGAPCIDLCPRFASSSLHLFIHDGLFLSLKFELSGQRSINR